MSHAYLEGAPLGREVRSTNSYDPSLLFPISRAANRESLGPVPSWVGADVWNAYEMSWLNSRGKPVVAIGRFTVPQDSPNLIESKSFKLYLNSYNDERFADWSEVEKRLHVDLSAAAGADVTVDLMQLSQAEGEALAALDGLCLDDLDVQIDAYTPAPQLLCCAAGAARVTETLTSNLLKSNCPVTGQPDWGSVQIRYTGPQIDRDGLLKYIISLRQHDEFHEHCVEQMYCDILKACQPEFLMVYARYTRRGGLDINPWRASEPIAVPQQRTARQ